MTTEAASGRTRRLTAVMREEDTVTPLELFFDLVFVLALTQCTALMADEPTWEGLAKGMLVLGVLWWSWVGYAWLTSVVDPEEDAVRLVIFVAMAALLVVGLSVPGAFDDSALIFALAYAVVVFHVAARRLAEATVGRVQNEMARDSYSYMHFLMVAGIVLVALGMKKTLGHVEDPLKLVPAAALLGGAQARHSVSHGDLT